MDCKRIGLQECLRTAAGMHVVILSYAGVGYIYLHIVLRVSLSYADLALQGAAMRLLVRLALHWLLRGAARAQVFVVRVRAHDAGRQQRRGRYPEGDRSSQGVRGQAHAHQGQGDHRSRLAQQGRRRQGVHGRAQAHQGKAGMSHDEVSVGIVFPFIGVLGAMRLLVIGWGTSTWISTGVSRWIASASCCWSACARPPGCTWSS